MSYTTQSWLSFVNESCVRARLSRRVGIDEEGIYLCIPTVAASDEFLFEFNTLDKTGVCDDL
jgi:hypothetical protein